MSSREQASAIAETSGPEPRSLPFRPEALVAVVVVLLGLIFVGLLLARAGPIRSPATAREDAEFRQRASALLDRYDGLSLSVGQLIAEQESNPSAQGDPAWCRRYDEAVANARALKASADALAAPESDRTLATDLSYGLGLYATGLSLLGTGFGMDGHGAYYYGSHGNWDVNLGTQRLETVRQALAAR